MQIAWAILSAIWNVAGVWLMAQGQPAPGPTASIGGAAILLALAAAFVVTVSRWPVVYLLLSIAAGLLGLGAVINAFSADPAMWPSQFWRYAGLMLNGAGAIASAWTVATFFRWRSGR